MRVGKRYGLGIAAITLFGLGVAWGTALADRSTTAPPIVYSGQILVGGVPATDGAHLVGLSLWPASTGVAGGLCDMPPASVSTVGGHFSLPLSSSCANVVQDGEELYVQLLVDGETLARVRVGATPFAVSAERVVFRSLTAAVTDGLYVGATPDAYTGDIAFGGLAGYEAARAACAAFTGSSTGHMCSSEEAARSLSLGIALEVGRTQGFTLSYNGAEAANDCVGWTSASSTRSSSGVNILATGAIPTWIACSTARPLLCCD